MGPWFRLLARRVMVLKDLMLPFETVELSEPRKAGEVSAGDGRNEKYKPAAMQTRPIRITLMFFIITPAKRLKSVARHNTGYFVVCIKLTFA